MTTNAAVQLSVKTSLVGVRLFQSPNHMNGAVHKLGLRLAVGAV